MAFGTIATALTIADKLGVTQWLGGLIAGDKGEQVAEKVVDMALEVTGADTAANAMDVMEEIPALSEELKALLINNEHELVKLAYADKAQAREMYQSKNLMADKIADRVMTWNLPMIVVMIVANVVVAIYIKESGVAQLLGNLIGMVTTQLYKERQTIVEFFFGAGLGGQSSGSEIKKGTP